MVETTRTNGATADLDSAARVTADAASRLPTNPPPDAVLGQVVWLMMNMPQYRHVFLADLEWMTLPPILLNQYRLFRVGDRVVVFAAWAYLSEAVEARLQGLNPRLAPSEWKSGDRLWLVDLHAPFGHQEAALKELREATLKGKAFRMHRWTPQGRQIVEFAAEESSPATV
jgi:cytolysin-activating lysine-acyltransferase